MYNNQEIKLVWPYVYGSSSVCHEINILNALFNQIVILQFHYNHVPVLYIPVGGIQSIKTREKLKLFMNLAFLTIYMYILFHYQNVINNVRISFKSNCLKYDCSHTYSSVIK